MNEPGTPQTHEEPDHVLWSRAQRFEREGDLERAVDSYAALTQRLLDASSPVPAYLCDRLGSACAALGIPRAAVCVLAGARSRMQALGDAYGALRMTVKLAQVCLGAVDLDGAERFLGDALFARPDGLAAGAAEALARARHLAVPAASADDTAAARVDACLTLARLWAAEGRYAAAIDAAEAARALSPGADAFFSRSGIGLFIAELHLDRGDTTAAYAEEQLARSRQGNAAAQERDAARWDALAARRALLEGRLSGARRLLERLAEPSGRPLTSLDLQIALALAGLLGQLNRLAEAERVLDQTAARLGESPAHEGWRRALGALALLLQRKRAGASRDRGLPFVPEQVLPVEDADEGLSGAPAAAPGPGPDGAPRRRVKERFADEWALRANALLLALDAGRLDAAAERLAALEALASRTDSPRLRARTRYFHALLAYHRGHHEQAQAALLACIEETRALAAPQEKLQVLELLAWAYARRDLRDDHRRASAEAKARLDALLASLDPEDRVYATLNRMSQQDHFIAARIAGLDALAAPSLPLPRIAAWIGAFRRRRELLARYREVSSLAGWDIDRHLSPDPSSGSADGLALPEQATASEQIEAWVRAELELARGRARERRRSFLDRSFPLFRIPRRSALLHYYAVADRLFAFLLMRGRIQLFDLPTTRIELYDAVREVLLEVMQQYKARIGGRRVSSALARLADALGTASILGPLVGQVDHVAIVPHDTAVHAPFAALPCGDQGALCEHFTLTCIPGPRWFAPTPARRAPARPRRFFGVGVRDYPGTRLSRLDGALREVQAVAAAMPGGCEVVTLEGRGAQPGAVLDALEQADWAHFACHGEFDRTMPHRSRLYVGGPGDTTGQITLADIQVRALRRLQLVVLASCWTASTALLPGSEPVCLPAAFLKAGAGGVVAPLWPVQDQLCVEFMKGFYEEARRHPPARALAEVQRRWLKGDARKEGMPFHWAAYLFHGAG
ncbi:CHAT domain-containing protein [Sorangium sp. So ce1389]|uniref:CHAT domain-containing protein n=1 Tax=Sorangium sp. So ce1389 TaxID=3133336 RepID=UPI003F5DB53D